MSEHEMTRRQMLGRTALVVGGTALIGGGALVETSCAPPKDLALYIDVGIEALTELNSLFPQLGLPHAAELSAKAIAVLDDVLKSYKDGKFNSALTFLDELIAPGGLFNQILDDIGAAHDAKVASIMLALNSALRIVGIILRSKADAHPEASAALKTARAAGGATAAKIAHVDALFDQSAQLEKALQSVRF